MAVPAKTGPQLSYETRHPTGLCWMGACGLSGAGWCGGLWSEAGGGDELSCQPSMTNNPPRRSPTRPDHCPLHRKPEDR